MKPLIGISCCVKPFGVFATPNHAASDSYVRAVLGPVDGIPVLLPAAGEALVPGILPRLDGLILTGSRSNVRPDHYDGPAHAEGTPEDPARRIAWGRWAARAATGTASPHAGHAGATGCPAPRGSAGR